MALERKALAREQEIAVKARRGPQVIEVIFGSPLRAGRSEKFSSSPRLGVPSRAPLASRSDS